MPTPDLNQDQDNSGQTALGVAILAGDIATVQALLDHGADVNVKDSLGTTALMKAVISSREITPMLLAKSANVNAKDNDGKTALMWAVDLQFHGGHAIPETVQLLLDKGAEVNAKDNSGRTALIWVSNAWGFSPIRDFTPAALEVLLTNGADVNAKDNRGQTALMSVMATLAHEGASSGDNLHTYVKSFIAHGADVNAIDNAGQTVLMRTHGSSLIRRMLKKAGATK
jgi:ankyrin repeat protein